jgi:AcrR family transcriptional regulator
MNVRSFKQFKQSLPHCEGIMASDAESKRGEDTRQSILEAAERLFLNQGFHGTSMRQIAQEAGGIAVGGIYNHFSSKEAIFQELASVRSPYARMGEALEHLEATDARGMIEEVIPRFQAIVLENVDFFQLVIIDVNELQGTTVRALVSSVIPQFLRFGQRLQAAGGLRDDMDPYVMLRMIASMLAGYTLTSLIAFSDGHVQIEGVPDYDEAFWHRQMVDVLLNGIAAPGEKSR